MARELTQERSCVTETEDGGIPETGQPAEWAGVNPGDKDTAFDGPGLTAGFK